MSKTFLVTAILMLNSIVPLSAYSCENQAMLEKLQDGYRLYKSTRPAEADDYVESMNELAISAIVFSSESQKRVFYSELKKKRNALYAFIFGSWTPAEIAELRQALSCVEEADFLSIGAKEFLGETR